ncbi:MAG: RNA pseudouridine synthase [Bacteroidales bacterium]|nr:RNA pseudouridine synthase [Bacteroidales bacterium]MDP2235861.1 RNA pseudouridine synthase [Bacteroidales bacterium]
MADVSNRILFEDNHLLIVNKLPSEIVQGDKTGDVSLLDDVKSYLKTTYNKQGNVFAGLVHRIDRPVSGAVVFAKTSKALTRMTALVRERDFDKKYLAIVRNKPHDEEGLLEHFLVKNEAQNKSYISKESVSGAKNAQLKYRLIGASKSFFLLEITLLTGRHHQIRVQLAAIGCPILGDLKYGDKRSNVDGSICLHAHTIVFEHPIKKQAISIVADMPKTMPWTAFF